MFITNLEIEHFRGIQKSNILFPLDSRVICMIGAGDNTKSTVLKAIEWVFWPSWNLIACDNDFYGCDTSTPIKIRCTFKEIPRKLISEDKFGLYLRKPHVLLNPDINDEPEDEGDFCLTIQLTIDSTLEPKWEVMCNRKEARPISHTDRKLLSVANVGNNCAKDMVWGKYSVLQKCESNAKVVLHDAHTAALRELASHADFPTLDDVGETLILVGQQYGVDFESQIKNKMFIQNGSFSSSVGLFDGNTPLNQKGTGSQRLLSMGLNIHFSGGNALLVIDEVESGLEPYRLCSLINEFRTTHTNAGQVIMTTHSPIAVAECTIGELLVVQSQAGETKVFQLKSNDTNADAIMQAQIRRNAGAFLCKRLIVCEGKTEIGFVRALDTFLTKSKGYRMAYKGVGTADGGGDTIFTCADKLHSCGYEVCLLMDSDLSDVKANKVALQRNGTAVFDWEEPNALEEQIFYDIPTNIATKLINIVVTERGLESVKSCLTIGNVPFKVEDDKIRLPELDRTTKKKIGTIAKQKSWYKRIDLGELLCNKLFESWEFIDESTRLKTVVDAISKWVIEND
jgi:hypothetical pseudogene protein